MTDDLNPILQSKVVGHNTTLSLLSIMLSSSRMPHALLFSGPLSIGKQTTALAVAAAALTEHSPSEEEKKKMLALVSSGTHPDMNILHLEEEKKNISVEAVRSFVDNIQLKPYFGHKKIAIIDRCHLMSPAAANSLLKTLEEPPGDALLILVSEASHRLLPTITSRCQMINFSFLTSEETTTVIARILQLAELEDKFLKPLTELCDGTLQPLQLEKYLEPKTLRISDEAGLAQHLATLVEGAETFKKQLKQLRQSSAAMAIQWIADLGKNAEAKTLFWFQMKRELGRKLRHPATRDTAFWANLLADFLQAERLVTERNANFELQLTPLIIRLAEAKTMA